MPANSPPRRATLPLSVVLGVLLVAAMALIRVGEFYRSSQLLQAQNVDVMGGIEEKYREIKLLLPPSGVVGYLADVPLQGNGLAPFFMARYILAPRLLVQVTEERVPEWVIGDFQKVTDYQTAARGRNLTVVRDFGRGLVLLRRKPE